MGHGSLGVAARQLRFLGYDLSLVGWADAEAFHFAPVGRQDHEWAVGARRWPGCRWGRRRSDHGGSPRLAVEHPAPRRFRRSRSGRLRAWAARPSSPWPASGRAAHLAALVVEGTISHWRWRRISCLPSPFRSTTSRSRMLRVGSSARGQSWRRRAGCHPPSDRHPVRCR